MTDDVLPANRKPGWYDDGTGTSRWWSGQGWTEHTTDQRVNNLSGQPRDAKPTTRHPLSDDPATIWSAVGRPMTGIGAGKYRLTAELLYFETGALSTRAQQIDTWQIHDVDASQSMTQKARGVGTITLHARRTARDEVVTLSDVAEFREGVRLINETARAAGNRKRELEHTQHVSYSGAAPIPAAPSVAASPAATAPSGGSDLMGELAKLAEYKQQGLLDDEEFAAAKRKLLGI